MIKQTIKPLFPELKSIRFFIRPLNETDVSEKYVRWFSDTAVREFIMAAQATQTIEGLKSYVRENLASAHAFLLGIFTLDGNQHIGNIKFDTINFEKKSSVVGILIGDPAWRGKGVFQEVFRISSHFLLKEWQIKSFWLGSDRKNTSAIQAYVKSGFKEKNPPASVIPHPNSTALYMCCELQNLQS